jgi:hypothetical protein
VSLAKKVVAAVVQTIRDHRAPQWFAEPVRTIANRVVGVTVLVTGVLASAALLTDVVPEQYRDQVAAVVAGIGAVNVVIAKWAGEIARNKVFSPATHIAEVNTARRKPTEPLAPQVPLP